MPDSIRDRLKRVPPFEDDIPMMRDVKKVAEQQTQKPPVEIEKKEEVEEPEVEETEVVEPTEEENKEETNEEEVKEEETEALEETTEEEKPEKEEKKSRTTEQFEKLKKSNSELKEENKKLYQDVLTSLRPQETEQPKQEFAPDVFRQIEKNTSSLPQEKVDDIYANLIDKDGYIDPDLLVKTLRDANTKAMEAERRAIEAERQALESEKKAERKFRDFEEDKEVRKVHKKFPQIDPNNEDFNELFWDDVRKEIATAPILRGENVTFMQAAEKIWDERYADKQPKEEVVEVKKKAKEEMEKKEDAKKNINAMAQSSYRQDYTKTDEEELIKATQHGVRGSIAERLRRAGQ